MTRAQERGDSRGSPAPGRPAGTTGIDAIRDLRGRRAPSRRGTEGLRAHPGPRDRNGILQRRRQDPGKRDQDSPGEMLVSLVVDSVSIASVLRIVPLVQHVELAGAEPCRQQVQVPCRSPMGMDPRRRPAECRSEHDGGQKQSEEEQNVPAWASLPARPPAQGIHPSREYHRCVLGTTTYSPRRAIPTSPAAPGHRPSDAGRRIGSAGVHARGANPPPPGRQERFRGALPRGTQDCPRGIP